MNKVFKWLFIALAAFILYYAVLAQVRKNAPKKTFPTDKEMLEHFNQHRSEIERLMKLHREYAYVETIKGGSTPLDRGERNALMKNAGVKRIIDGPLGWSWYPDNYSEHTKRTLKSIDNLRSTFYVNPNHGSIEPEIIKILKKEIPSLFNKDLPVVSVGQVADLTQVMQIELADTRYQMFVARKIYIHFPQPPMIQNNRIMVNGSRLEENAPLKAAERIVSSLDNPPPDWQPGECLLKPIDTQWFMATCQKPGHSKS